MAYQQLSVVGIPTDFNDVQVYQKMSKGHYQQLSKVGLPNMYQMWVYQQLSNVGLPVAIQIGIFNNYNN